MKVTIGNSFSKVEGLSRTSFDRLRDFVAQKAPAYGVHSVPPSMKLSQTGRSVTVKDAKGRLCPVFTRKGLWPSTVATAEKFCRSLVFRGDWFQLTRHIDARGGFPTGLLPYVKAFAAKHHIPCDLQDTRKPPRIGQGASFIPGRTPPPYPDQIEALKASLSARHGSVVLPTGTGKSLVIGMIVDALKLKTLIVVPTVALKTQLTESFNEWFGPNHGVTIENIDSTKLKTAKDFDVLIIDEAHHSAAATYRKLNRVAWSGIYYRFFFTATPFRSNDDERMLLEGIAGQVIYRLEYQKAVDSGYIVPIEAYFFDLPEQEMKGNPKDWHSVYSELIVNNDYRNRLICHLIKQLSSASALCLTKEVEHGRRIAELTGVPFACGEDGTATEALARFNSKASGCLVGTTGVVGEGVDCRPTEYVILGAGGKSKVQFMQQVGRVLRRYPGKTSGKVILFRDKSSKYLLDHYRLCVQYLAEEYGITPIKLELPEDVC